MLDGHLLLLARQMRAAEEGQNQTKQILLFTTTEKQCSTFLPRCLKTNAEKKMGSHMMKLPECLFERHAYLAHNQK